MVSKEDIIVFICGLIAFVYLLNPTFGMIELIPDNLPIIGNLDEAGATAIVMYAFRHFGIDFLSMIDAVRGQRPRRR